MDSSAGRKATLVLLSNLAGAVLGYAGLLLIGRYFAPASYGSYLFALGVTGLFAVVSNLGLGMSHQRHIAQGVDPGRAFGVLVRLRLMVAVPLLAIAALAYLVWASTHERAVTDATTPTVLALALTVQLVSGARQTLLDTWQGQQRVHRSELVRSLDTVLAVAFLGNAALMVAHLQGRWEVIPGIGAFWADRLSLEAPPSVAEGALILAGAYLLAKAVSFAVALAWWATDRVQAGGWDRDLARSYVRFALPVALAGVLALILQYTDTVMLGFFWTAREVGLYGAAQKVSALVLIGATAVGTVLFPRFAQLHASGDTALGATTFRRAERYLLLLVTPVAAAMVALPREGLHVAVGDAYLDAALPLRLLAVWALMAAAEMPMSARFMGEGRLAILARAGALNVLLNIALNLAFIPKQGLGLGPTGAAIATVASTSLSYAYLRWTSHRAYGIPWASADQLRIGASGVVAAAFWLLVRWRLGPAWFDRVWELGCWGVAGVAVYGVALALLGGLRARDLRFLGHIGHPGRLLAELRGR